MRLAFTFPTPLFRPTTPLRNAALLVALTSLFYFIGAEMRLVSALSLFWPLNGVMAAVFARVVWLNRLRYYAVTWAAMLLYDMITTRWGSASLVINFSNMLFIVLVAQLILRDRRRQSDLPDPLNALRIMCGCLLASLLSALVGALGSEGITRQTFWPLYADWFSEQFSTGVLLLPCLLTLRLPCAPLRAPPAAGLPLLGLALAIAASVAIGGAGSLAFPLPALIWCAVRYSLATTCLLTLLTGALEIILVANGSIDIAAGAALTTDMMFSARLGIAVMAICPVMVAVSMAAIHALIKQVSLRADYDFLTRVYSRSGLYEALRRQPEEQTGPAMTVMLLDIDYFKRINDEYGHECGDRMLADFAGKVQEMVGDAGLVARMGGEEFAVVLVASGGAEGFALAERIRQAVASHPFQWRQHPLRLTVSIGLGSGQGPSRTLTESVNTLLAEADEFLYRAKKAGRNRTHARSVKGTTAMSAPAAE
ncbi:GGDEF domain-containing protein [Pantoea sp. 1.19]|uniref:GGDEF domain-containing protein n=1 Tax=Pantoea sp. 1.19 TaxID=1925589 RepID=UPI00094918A1|nr:GGDEF domain-containing protein [Pantoea sp. 1.19]